MAELRNTRMYVYGGSPAVETIQYKGMAGNQGQFTFRPSPSPSPLLDPSLTFPLPAVLDWADLDTEIISAGLTNDPLRPPQLIVSGNA